MEKQRRNFFCKVFGHRWEVKIKKHRKTYYCICSRCKVKSDEAVMR